MGNVAVTKKLRAVKNTMVVFQYNKNLHMVGTGKSWTSL